MKKTLLFTTLATMGAMVANAGVKDMVSPAIEVVHVDAPLISVKDQKVVTEFVSAKSNAKYLHKVLLSSNASESVSPKTPLYARPSGAYYLGLSDNSSAYSYPILVVAPWTDYTWYNLSKETTNSWSYAIGDNSTAGGDEFSSKDKDLVFSYDAMTYSSTPTLTAGKNSYTMHTLITDASKRPNWIGQETQGMVISSGLPAISTSEGQSQFAVSTVPFHSLQSLGISDEQGNPTGSYWFGKKSLIDNGFLGLGTIMTKPSMPYLLTSASLWMRNLKISGDGELKLTLYPVNDEGEIDMNSPIATGYATSEDVISFQGSNTTAAKFKFYEEDDMGGRTQVNLLIDRAFYAEFSGYADNDNVSFDDVYLNPGTSMDYADYSNPDPEDNYTTLMNVPVEYVAYVRTSQGLLLLNTMFKGDSFGEDKLWSFHMGFDALFGAINLDKSEFAVAKEGGSAQFIGRSNVKTDYIAVEDDYAQYADWIKVGIVSQDKETGDITFGIEVSPLAEGTTGRKAEFHLTTSWGGSALIKVTQGDGGVSAVESGANKVVAVADGFQVTAAKAGLVEVYNVAGQKVAEAQVDGTVVVPASNLAKGLYLVKFADNSVVKVMK